MPARLMQVNADGTAARLPSGLAAPAGCGDCCGTYYLLAEPCEGTKDACDPVTKPNLWLCVDAVGETFMDAMTIRERYGPLEGAARCFTFLWHGWCYNACYKELDDGDDVRVLPPEGEPYVACGETVTIVPTDCTDELCPAGVGYIEAVLCDGEQAEDAPTRIFICAGAVDRRFIFRMVKDPPLFLDDICYCVTPGDGIPFASIPVGAMIITALDFSTPGVVAFDNNLNSLHYAVPWYTSCCGCLAGCSTVDLRGDPLNPCCCGEAPSIIDYNVDFVFTRTIPREGGTDTLTYTGRGSGTGGPYATLPYNWTSVSVIGGVTTTTTDTPEWTPWWLCGFLEANGWPPDSFVDAMGGSESLGGGEVLFDFTDTLTGLNPVGEPDPAGTGRWTGVTKASCNSISITVTGTVTASDGTVDEVVANVYLFIDRDADARCTGVCDGPEAIDPMELLP